MSARNENGSAAADLSHVHTASETCVNVVRLRPSDVIATHQINSRQRKVHDLRSEAVAFKTLAALTVEDSHSALHYALDIAVQIARAGSAGISLLTTDETGQEVFRCMAMRGPLADRSGRTVPRDCSPCGLCLDAGHAIVVGRPSSAFASFDSAVHPLIESLIVPLYDAGMKALGTLWIVHHKSDEEFDVEDIRIMEHLAEQVVLALKLCDAASAAQEHAAQAGVDERDPDALGANSFVRKLDGLVPLSSSDRTVLAQITAGGRCIEPGKDILREDAAPDGTYVVVEGYACRYKLRSDGARQITNYLVPGDFCEIDISLGTMNHSVGTLSACTVVKIAQETLSELAQGHPAIAQALRMSRLVDEATSREWLMNIGRRSAEERIAHLFCELLTRMQAVGLVQDNSFRLPLTQFDLGDTIGLSYVHVNRTLQSLRQQGLIVLRGKTLTVLDIEGLEALAEFKPCYLKPVGRTVQQAPATSRDARNPLARRERM